MKLKFVENKNGVKTGVKITALNKLEQKVISDNKVYLNNLLNDLVEESKKRNNQTPAK